MREIVDGVGELAVGYVHVHAVVDDRGVILVDTGLPGREAAVADGLRRIGRRIRDVHTILLTHRHPDHTGAAAALRAASGARVVAHAADAPAVTGNRPDPPRGVLRLAARVMGTPAPTPVDDWITGGGPVPGLPHVRAVPTPGHTPGHTAFLLDRAGGVLFAGDAAGGGPGGRVCRPPRLVTADRAGAETSIRSLGTLDFEVAVFGHGRAVTSGAARRFRDRWRS
ncbi:MBL fold metallo-hydrolase [Pilimelia terevasa]|uniref:MBL fold metallo-hydrolase n=1 Tax=Pilimelia terevasa TaxID=53372 RepID=A0A8J3FJQ5_9ACTN|nr:MBL fold metallo-hydrolase [Pilimelia terevasa]GGK42066.1 MBL fold metallo-hydrolase [Pilimelia terevasa]